MAFPKQVANAPYAFAELEVTVSRDITLADANKTLTSNQTTAIVLTVQPEATTKFEIGQTIQVFQGNTGTVSFASGVGVTFQGTAVVSERYRTISLKYRGSNVWVWSGASTSSNGSSQSMDGGSASSNYTLSQQVDGGIADSTYST